MHELKNPVGTWRRCNLPADRRGGHPAKHLGYLFDGRAPAEPRGSRYLANTPFKPPAIKAATSVSTIRGAMPPGQTR